MTLADYTFYAETYKGDDIPSDLFGKYSAKADYMLKRLTNNKLILDYYETEYNLAVCEIADYYYDSDQNSGKVLTSESVGSYSVNYAVNPNTEYDLALQYLAHTGLLNSAVLNYDNQYSNYNLQ